jgi:hypothetical protein
MMIVELDIWVSGRGVHNYQFSTHAEVPRAASSGVDAEDRITAQKLLNSVTREVRT